MLQRKSQSKCVPIILYGVDACPLNSTDKQSLDFVLNRSLMKLFQTGSNVVLTECRNVFNIKLLSELVIQRKVKFLTKFSQNSNCVCQLFAATASEELWTVLRGS